MSSPLVSIGIPTFNRASSLPKSVDAALQQTYPNIEVIISDNASTDDTLSICEKFVETDKRVTYIRQQSNVGAAKNFGEVLQYSTGQYFMWLADDDWIDPNYIEECVKELIKYPDYSLIIGKTKVYVNRELVREEIMNLEQESGMDRMLTYYPQACVAFYGLMRRSQISKIPIMNTIGCDWLVIASLAYLGKIKTILHVSIHKDEICINSKISTKRLDSVDFQGNNPFLVVALSAAKYILTNPQIYGSLNILQRIVLSQKVLICLLRTKHYPISRAKILTSLRSRIPASTYSQVRTLYRKIQGKSSP
jgi:glycosyltransferase involved in cell wall biosynthesis